LLDEAAAIAGRRASPTDEAFQMQMYTVAAGDTWDSIATANEMPTSWLLLGNGHDPNASPAAEAPEEGTDIVIPPSPPDHPVAPENSNALDLGAGGLETIRLRLHDHEPGALGGVRYSATSAMGPTSGTSDGDGWITIVYPAGTCATITVQWGAADGDSPHPYQAEIVVDCFTGGDEATTIARLNNLGFDATDLPAAVSAFQIAYGVDEDELNDDGTLPDATKAALDAVYEDYAS
jgi:hypothetical protein